MIIPKLHYISQGNSPKEHLENIQKACSSGAELVQLHLKNITEKKHLKLAKEAREITAHFQTRLIIFDNFKIAVAVKADGVHLGENDSCTLIARTQLFTWQTIGGTAHTLQDCEALMTKEVDYMYLASFSTTTTEDDTTPALGLKGFHAIIDAFATPTPIIGFGGITTADVTDILKTGITGIAVSDEITHDFNSIGVFNQLLSASSTEEQRYSFKKS